MSKGHRAKVMGHPPTGPIKVMLIPRGCHPQVGWSLSVLGQWEAESVLTVKGSGQGFLPYSLLQAESPALGISPPLLQPPLVTVLPLLLDGPESSLRYHCVFSFISPFHVRTVSCCCSSPSCLTIPVGFLRCLMCVTPFLK